MALFLIERGADIGRAEVDYLAALGSFDADDYRTMLRRQREDARRDSEAFAAERTTYIEQIDALLLHIEVPLGESDADSEDDADAAVLRTLAPTPRD